MEKDDRWKENVKIEVVKNGMFDMKNDQVDEMRWEDFYIEITINQFLYLSNTTNTTSIHATRHYTMLYYIALHYAKVHFTTHHITESLEMPNLSMDDMQRLQNSDNQALLESSLKEPIEDVLKFYQVISIGTVTIKLLCLFLIW